MKKWGVRLIGILFLLSAVSAFGKLFKGGEASFWGIYINIFGWDISSLVNICVSFYIGYSLLKFNKMGRTWALTLLWLGVFSSAWAFVFSLTAIKANQTIDTRFGEIDAFLFIILLYLGIFIALSVPLYYLERRDIKALFEPPTIPDISQTATDVKV